MFFRRWKWFGRLRSDEGFSLTYQHRSVIYEDSNQRVELFVEDGILFVSAASPPEIWRAMSEGSRAQIADRVRRGLEWDGYPVQVDKPVVANQPETRASDFL